MNPHDGHRERLRTRIQQEGIGSLADHEVLEYFLFAFVPRRDTNLLAHRLIDRFGSLSDVLDADYNALVEIEGMTANAALFLSELPAFFVRYKQDKAKRVGNHLTTDEAIAILNDVIGQSPTERCAAIALDVRGNSLGTLLFESDQSDSVTLDMRYLVKELLLRRASGVLVAHNHPSGDVKPSHMDYEVYLSLVRTLSHLDIDLVDCVILGGNKSCSIAKEYKRIYGDVTPAAARTDSPRSYKDEYDDEMQELDLLFNRNNRRI